MFTSNLELLKGVFTSNLELLKGVFTSNLELLKGVFTANLELLLCNYHLSTKDCRSCSLLRSTSLVEFRAARTRVSSGFSTLPSVLQYTRRRPVFIFSSRTWTRSLTPSAFVPRYDPSSGWQVLRFSNLSASPRDTT